MRKMRKIKVVKKHLLFAVLTAAASMWVLGCGSSDNGNETTGSLTKAQFLKKGDQICKKRLEEKDAVVKMALEEAGASGGGEVPKQIQQEVSEKIVAFLQKITTELDELLAPAPDKAAVQDFTTKLEIGLKKAEANPVGLLRSDPFEKAADAARAYGFTACNL